MKLGEFNVHHLTTLCEYLLDGEPVFIIRSQDKAAVASVAAYIEETKKVGGINVSRCTRHMERIKEWQVKNPGRVKSAD